jgi:cystathionine beta-lyase
MIGPEIADSIKPNTKVVYLEAPSSNTFEILDVKTVVDAIRKKSNEIGQEIAILFDNTWAGPLYFRTFDHDIDVEIQAATKYVVGHSDAMLGIVACNEKTFLRIKNSARSQGICAEPDACYLGLRGLRTMAVRMEAQFESAMKIASWLDSHSMVETVLFPPLPSSKYFKNWEKYFTGGGSLMSIVLNQKFEDQDLEKFFDQMQIFSMGYSWGGFESLATPVRIQKDRKSSLGKLRNTIVRVHIGLEDPEDLISDLNSAFKRL